MSGPFENYIAQISDSEDEVIESGSATPEQMEAAIQQFMTRGQAAQAAVDDLTKQGRPRKPHPDLPADFTPRCMACGGLIPPNRAGDSRRNTCSPECAAVMKEFRRQVTKSRKCLLCLRPASEQERADFRAWRLARGKQERSGRPPQVKLREAETLLGEIADLLQVVKPAELSPELAQRFDSSIEKIRRYKPKSSPAADTL